MYRPNINDNYNSLLVLIMIYQLRNGLFVKLKEIAVEKNKNFYRFGIGCNFFATFSFVEASNFTLDSDWLVTNHSLLLQVCDNTLCTQ